MMTLQAFLDEWNSERERVLVHTSGSTGQPKPLWVEKRRMEASARITCDFLGLQAGNTALLCMPLDFIAGKMMVVRTLVRGLQLFCVQPDGHPLRTRVPSTDGCICLSSRDLRQDGHRAWQLSPAPFPSGGAFDFVAMVPLQVWNSLQVETERERLKAVRHLIIGGGAVDEQLAGQLRSFPNAVWSTYGMTETLSHIALRRLSGPDASPWYTPFDGVTVSLSSEGCLVIDAPHVCESPLLTNDLAELTTHPATRRTLFRILGRRDNVVCSGGLKIQMEEVERLLHPHLSEAFLVTKCPDSRLGEAVVLLTEGSTDDALQSFCRRLLPQHWAPRHYVHVDHIPLTATGKPARAVAAAMARQLCGH